MLASNNSRTRQADVSRPRIKPLTRCGKGNAFLYLYRSLRFSLAFFSLRIRFFAVFLLRCLRAIGTTFSVHERKGNTKVFLEGEKQRQRGKSPQLFSKTNSGATHRVLLTVQRRTCETLAQVFAIDERVVRLSFPCLQRALELRFVVVAVMLVEALAELLDV